MTPEIEALARRAIACEGWRWMPGMLAHHPNWRAGRVSHVGLTAVRVACRYPSPVGGTEWAVPALPITDLLPDFSDPLTVQALLLLVLEAWGDVQFIMTYSPCNGWWNLYFGEHPDRVEFVGLSLAGALVATLEAAP